MPASQAQIDANRRNAALSSGPVTPEGKERSRANAYKHGLTGAGIVLPEREAVEVERRVAAFEAELQPSGEVGQALVRRAAVLSVRMERCVAYENALLTERVRLAEAEFAAPEDVDLAEAARLRTIAGKRALFDPSPEASLARRYEAAAERGFFRALKELRQVEGAARAAEAGSVEEMAREGLGSFSRVEKLGAEFDASYPDEALPAPRNRLAAVTPAVRPAPGGGVDVPFSIGRGR